MVSSPQESGGGVEELNITVAVRCRGRNEREINAKSSVVVSVPDVTGSNEVSINTTGDIGITAQINSKTYMVDKVFGPSANQSLIFQKIAEPLFADFIKGYNCTVLVYGMTSTGKTYTMTGDEKLYNGELSDSAGIIPRILFKLFETLELQNEDYVVKCSFVELYNEELKDLLNDSRDSSSFKRLRIFDSNSTVTASSGSNNSSRKSSRNNSPRSSTEIPPSTLLRKRMKSTTSSNILPTTTQHVPPKAQQHQMSQDQNGGIYIQNLQEFHITRAKEGIELLQKGLRHRQVATTKMNDFSSRSHTIFTITLYKEHDGEIFRVSKMNLVDLAGSENISRSGAQHQRAKEAGSINQSLLTLGRVINSLADKSVHVPFRESKLTRLLQDSLGGNTKTALIATISPAKINSEETCSTLQYAAKAKNIKNKPQLGSVIMKDILVKNITGELAKIKSDLLSTKLKEGIYMNQDNYKELTNDLESYKTEVQECKRVIERLSSQNSLLLKDKKASNQVNDLQNIKLQNMRESMGELYNKIEKQHKREQDLVGMTSSLKSTMSSMQVIIKEYGKREQDLKSKMRVLLGEEFLRFKYMLVENLEDIKQSGNGNTLDIRDNLDIVKREVLNLLEMVQGQAEKLYKDCMGKIMEETPAFFEIASCKVSEVESMVNSYHSELSENLSDISEEYNTLKQYLNDHFFKNNHEEVLVSHIDRTYHHIQASANSLFQKFKEMMDDHLEENKNLMVGSLRTATSEVIDKEMQLFEPQRKRWEESFEYINKCDSINNVFHNDIRSALSHIKTKIGSSTDSINETVTKVKTQVNDYEDASAILNNNKVLNKRFEDILHRDVMLKKRVEKSIASTQEYVTVFDRLKNSIMHTVSSEAEGNRTKTIDELLKKLDEERILPCCADRTPLKPAMLQLNNVNERIALPRSNSQSPFKQQLHQNKSSLKRHHTEAEEEREENINKVPRKN